MIGNDVVDLADPECGEGARHPGFDARVFAPSERARIAAAEDPTRARWILWAAKEAAYKAARRQEPGTVFSPIRFEVRPEEDRDADLRGTVHHPGGALRVRVDVSGDCVQAVATAPDRRPEEAIQATESRGATEPGRAARGLALRTLARRSGTAPGELRIGREGRLPHLTRHGGGTLPLSLSHHGRFVGFAALDLGSEHGGGPR